MSDITETDHPTRPSMLETGAGTLNATTLRDGELGRHPADSQAPAPEQIGRYTVLSRLGAGAMGVVYAAYDPELDRKVAVKLIKVSRGRVSTSANARLLREAQALAKLDHPNVVPVHDAGSFGGQVFIAMKFVEGQTLGDWLKNEPRPALEDLLRVFARAGRGLAAAHIHGLVHRDFKPDNVMIGSDGQVRVMDFGLVRSDADQDELPDDEPDLQEAGEQDPLDPRLTRTGALLGTPAYMSPELFTGDAASVHSDQFAFCVSLYAGLYGERPFPGETLATIVFNATEGKVRPPPTNSTVPTWLRKVVLRGLRANPSERWPDMPSLLEALADDPAVRRRRSLVVGAATASLVGLVAVAGMALQSNEKKCADSARHLSGIWDAPIQEEIGARIEASPLPFASASWQRTQAQIQEWSLAWVDARRDACEDTQVRGEQSAKLLDLRMACLDDHLGTLGATSEVLREADDAAIRRLSKLAGGLPDLTPCSDPAYLTAEVRPPTNPTEIERVGQIEEMLAQSSALGRAGQTAKALEVAKQAWSLAQGSAHEPIQVRARQTMSHRRNSSGEYDSGLDFAKQAFYQAVRLRMHRRAGIAARSAVYTLGYHLGRHDEALEWGLHAQANFGDEPDARLEANLGATLLKKGDYAEARLHLDKALALYTEQEGADSYKAATVHMNFSALASYEGKHEESLDHIDATLVGYAKYYGPDHPEVGNAHLNKGGALAGLARWDEALAETEKSRTILEEALGPDHADCALPHMNLGIIAFNNHKYQSAVDHTKRALEIKRSVLGDDAGEVGDLWINLSAMYHSVGDLDEARHAGTEALRISEKVHGPEHQRVASALNNLGSLLSEEGDYEGALAHDERALAIRLKALGEDHPLTAESLGNLGAMLIRLERYDEAREVLLRALASTEGAHGKEHPKYAGAIAALAGLDGKEKKYAAARSGYERAIHVHEASQGKEDANLSGLLSRFSKFELDGGFTKRALPLAERAFAIAMKHEAEGLELAGRQFLLARALRAAPSSKAQDNERALELARAAREIYAEKGKSSVDELADVDAWLGGE
jgi:tetratricopeptide (TPR) repeat protein/predicted Ser/Thr protein kinase